MANINNTTPDIIVNVIINKNDTNLLDFIIEDEYHLKKVSIGAHVIKINKSSEIKRLYDNHYSVISCGDYVILCNLTQDDNIKVLMFNCAENKLNKNDVLFQTKIFVNNKINAETFILNPITLTEIDNNDTRTTANVHEDEDKNITFEEQEQQHDPDSDMGEVIDDGGPSTTKKQKLDNI